MDLSEVPDHAVRRHPWEAARAHAIGQILRRAQVPTARIFDFGCGDGFTGEVIARQFGSRRLLGLDVHLSEADCLARSRGERAYVRTLADVDERDFDVCLLCDVIEHVADDRALLAQLRDYVATNGYVLVTVPSFPSLYSRHDRALRHFRRYSASGLDRAIHQSGYDVVGSGFLFASLLPARAVVKLTELLRPEAEDDSFGIGRWSGGPLFTRGLESALRVDNEVLLRLAARGIKIPGLSAWALSKKR